MKTNDLSYYSHKSKSDYYINEAGCRNRWEHLYPSVQYYLDKVDFSGESFLEVGCAAGGMYEILDAKCGNVQYTGMEISQAEVDFAKKAYPNATFCCGNFYENDFADASFDTVTAFMVVNHQERYRDFIAQLLRVARKRVIFDARIQYDYPTVVDLQTSYLYYHGSGARNYFIPFNFYELFNYLHLAEFNAKKISVYGYYTPNKSSAFIQMPKSKLIAAAFCIEKYEPGTKVERWGGRPETAEHDWVEHVVELPDFSMKDI